MATTFDVADSRPTLSLAVVRSLSKLKTCIENRETRLRLNSLLVLVCGAKCNPDRPTARSTFLRYAKKHLQEYRFFEAEQVLNVLARTRKTDLLSLEGEFAGYSDCIIIIVESAGAIAELGAFAMEDKVARNVLAINSETCRDPDSFISLGPIRKLDRKSFFRPVLHTNLEHVLDVATGIEERLKKIHRSNRERVDVSSFSKFENCPPKHRMLFLYDCISMLCPVSFPELIGFLRFLYGNKGYQIKVDLGMLEALALVTKTEGLFLSTWPSGGLFLDWVGLDTTSLRSDIIRFYQKRDRTRLAYLARD